MSGLATGVRHLASAAGARAVASVNEASVRIAVTGLSRAGKTVFITSLVQNLIALGKGQNTLPRLAAALNVDGVNRLVGVEIAAPGASAIPTFDIARKFSDLASETPAWPPRTEDIAQISLTLEIRRADAVLQRLGNRKVRIDILDYPGEWLLDLPLLPKTYLEWSKETLPSLKLAPRNEICAEFIDFLRKFEAGAPADEAIVSKGHNLYRSALSECRTKLGMRYLQPGGFLCPGSRANEPFLKFFPIDFAGSHLPRGSMAALLSDRFEAYKADIRGSFFDTHFMDFNRQIVLVDVLGALHAGQEAYEDIERALRDIASCFRY